MKPLMTREEVAEALKVSTWTVRRYEQRGVLPRVELSEHAIRYRHEDVDKLIEKRVCILRP